MAPLYPLPQVMLFPATPKVKLTDSGKMKEAIADAVQAVVDAKPGSPPAPFALTIVDTKNFAAGGYNEYSEHYSASVVKVGVAFAAFALRDMLRRFVSVRNPSSVKVLHQMLATDMERPIEQSSRTILGLIANRKYRLPKYGDVFSARMYHDRLDITFSPAYAKALEDMMIPSSNQAAAACVHGVGYSYLNGALTQDGFFDDASKKGVWMGGDYTGEYLYARIPCANDKDTAQGATSRTLAHLMAVIHFDDILSAESHQNLQDLMSRSTRGPDPSYLVRSRRSSPLPQDQVTHTKIGYGPLKSGTIVYSEACRLRGIGPAGGSYVVAYLNVDWQPYNLDDMLSVIRGAITAYES
jgi:Beta-lactamase enzyme family